jgi:hypothetical protein
MIELESAMTDRSIVDKSVLLNEVLYFVASMPDSEMTHSVREAYITEAARKQAISAGIAVSLSDAISKAEKTKLLNALNSQAGGVHDYESFLGNVKYVNTTYNAYFEELNTDYRSLIEKTEYSRWGYLFLYLFGTAVTLAGIKREIPN